MADLSQIDVHMSERGYDNLAEKHAYSMGYMDGANVGEKQESETSRNWPNAYSAGFWDGKALG